MKIGSSSSVDVSSASNKESFDESVWSPFRVNRAVEIQKEDDSNIEPLGIINIYCPGGSKAVGGMSEVWCPKK